MAAQTRSIADFCGRLLSFLFFSFASYRHAVAVRLEPVTLFIGIVVITST